MISVTIGETGKAALWLLWVSQEPANNQTQLSDTNHGKERKENLSTAKGPFYVSL